MCIRDRVSEAKCEKVEPGVLSVNTLDMPLQNPEYLGVVGAARSCSPFQIMKKSPKFVTIRKNVIKNNILTPLSVLVQ